MRKKITPLLFGMLLFVACEKKDDDISAPETQKTETIENAQILCNSDLVWLKAIIKMADEDKATGKYKTHYIGSIYVTTYQNEPVFYCFMSMGDGLALGHTFNCSGTKIYPGTVDGNYNFPYEAKKKGKLLYTNLN